MKKEKKEKVFQLRVSKSELDALKNEAKLRGFKSVSKFILTNVLKYN